MKTIFADFQNADRDGFVRLNCDETLADLASNGIALAAGMPLVLTDGELTTDAVIVEPAEEGVWRAQIDWNALIDSADG